MYVTNQKTPVTLGLSVEVAANCTMTWTVRNEKGRYVQGTWALKASPAPVQDFQTRIRLPIAGTLHEVELSIPCTTATKIRTVQLGTLPRGPRLN